uniref:Uncharacterized protein n=1 Tax=Arundo donax TaxID=35708 RepID=A0A0A9FPD8_ARUDO
MVHISSEISRIYFYGSCGKESLYPNRFW